MLLFLLFIFILLSDDAKFKYKYITISRGICHGEWREFHEHRGDDRQPTIALVYVL